MGSGRLSTRLALVLAAVAVVLQAASLSLTLVFEPPFMYRPSPVPGYEWHVLVGTVGAYGTYLLALLTAPAAFYAVGVREEDLNGALAGFAAGALLYGGGNAVVRWLASLPTFMPLRFWVRGGLLLGGLFLLLATLGALAGDVFGTMTRYESADERW